MDQLQDAEFTVNLSSGVARAIAPNQKPLRSPVFDGS
jgi:hypothetical protein